MNRTQNNLLLNLYRWASKQDENFLTEAFVHLVQHLLENEPPVAINILKKFTGGKLSLTVQDVPLVNITAQVTTSTGRPDIEIKTLDSLIYIEVKLESGLGQFQLRRYRQALANSGFKNTGLIFLSRYPVILKENEELPDITVRWYQVAEWLEVELSCKTIQHPESVYLVKQFVGFLQGRNMTMEQVSWEFIRGVQSLRSLMEMLNEALTSAKVSSFKFTMARDWIGYLIGRPKQYFIGIRTDRPHMLIFNTVHIIEDDSDQFDFGRITQTGRWINELDFTSEEVHFFALSKASQLQCIERFLIESLAAVKQIQS
ncbi:MAG: hypothetical protein L6R45_07080 [Anaerolineae bacterium]|nr:hypothetical protein [Anaerolineae bacterium]